MQGRRRTEQADQLTDKLLAILNICRHRQMNSVRERRALLDLLAREAARLMEADRASIFLLDRDKGELWSTVALGSAEPLRFDARLGIAGAVVATGQMINVTDAQNDSRFYRGIDVQTGYHTRSLLAAPLVNLEGQGIGVFEVLNKTDGVFTAADEEILSAFAAQAAIALENSRLYEELRATLEEVEASQQRLVQTERLRALGEMAAGVAHDFNNLLGVILGRAELLLRRVHEPDLIQGLEAIRKAVTDGVETVRRIQEFTRTRRTSPFWGVDLLKLLREVVELTRPRWQDEAQSRGVRYEVRVEGEPVPPVAGIAEELDEVFTNLLTNALEAMPTGGSFGFRVSADTEWVVVRAEDSGPGMGEETRRRAFEPFFTTKGPRGTGLGLAVAWGIVTRHGGRIDVESTLGKGSVFTVRLPVGHNVLTPEKRAPAAAPGLPRAARVLVIEDEPQMQAVLKEVLTGDGYTVIEAADGTEGLARCEAEPVDLIVSDLSMPGMSGWEVAEACQARFPGIPLGLITGWGDQLDPEQLQRHRIRFVVAKPFKAAELLRQVAQVLSANEAT